MNWIYGIIYLVNEWSDLSWKVVKIHQLNVIAIEITILYTYIYVEGNLGIGGVGVGLVYLWSLKLVLK